MLRLYKILGIALLLAFAWVDYRGWAPGTEQVSEEASEASNRSNNGSIRYRKYRGGK